MTNPMQSRDIGELVLFIQDGGEHTKHELSTLKRLIEEREYGLEETDMLKQIATDLKHDITRQMNISSNLATENENIIKDLNKINDLLSGAMISSSYANINKWTTEAYNISAEYKSK